MREAALPGVVRHRVRGPAALVKRLHALRLAVQRFATHRARTRDEVRWAGRLADALDVAAQGATRQDDEVPS